MLSTLASPGPLRRPRGRYCHVGADLVRVRHHLPQVLRPSAPALKRLRTISRTAPVCRPARDPAPVPRPRSSSPRGSADNGAFRGAESASSDASSLSRCPSVPFRDPQGSPVDLAREGGASPRCPRSYKLSSAPPPRRGFACLARGGDLCIMRTNPACPSFHCRRTIWRLDASIRAR